MPSPYALLAAFALAVGLFGSGVSIGYKWESRAHAAAVLAAQNEAIDRANRDVEAATKLAVQQIAKEADARVRAAGVRRKGEIDSSLKAKLECVRDVESMSLLQSSIDEANGVVTK